jgi:hypothetical protein
MECIVTNCGRPTHSANLCQSHYIQKREGRPFTTLKVLHTSPDKKERIVSRVVVDKSTGCWNWSGLKNPAGYGRMMFSGDAWLVPRFSYFAFRGRIPKNTIVCHTCDNPGCANPDHLFLGTHKTNADDKVLKRRHPRHSVNHCVRGHEFTPENTHYFACSPTARRCNICLRERANKNRDRKNWLARELRRLRRS